MIEIIINSTPMKMHQTTKNAPITQLGCICIKIRYLFQVGFMLTDLTDIDKTAQAKVGAETWTVKSDKAPLLKGTKVKVLAIEGVKLIVEPVTE